MSIVPEFHLEHLFRRMFTPSELRQALFFAPDRGDLSDHLLDADRVSPASFARQAVAAAVARGLPFTQGLWSYLAELKPERAAEIWAVAALFGVHHPKAGALEPLPAEWADHVVAEEGLRTFVGRGEQLRQLRDTLLPRAGRVRAAVVCNLRGMAGVGKSFLVERFYASHREAFPGGHQKLILGALEQPTGESLLRTLAERLNVLRGEGPLAARVRAAALSTRALVHVDNVDTVGQAKAAAGLVRLLPDVPVLVSGRYRFDDQTTGWQLVPVDPFDMPDALAQLDAELTHDIGERVLPQDRMELVKALWGLPLAIRLASSYLNAGYRVHDFLAELQASGLTMNHLTATEASHLDRAQLALVATFDISLAALRAELAGESDEGMRGVSTLGVAPLVGVGRDLLNTIVGATPVQVIRWVSRAVRLSIVQFDSSAERWRVHKLLSERLRLLHPAELPAAQERLDNWMLTKLPDTPEDDRLERWTWLQAERDALVEWVEGLDGARAINAGKVARTFPVTKGPYAEWISALGRGLAGSITWSVRSLLLSRRAELALHAGDLGVAMSCAAEKSRLDRTHGDERGVAMAQGQLAKALFTRGALDAALRIHRDETLPVFERLRDAHNVALEWGCIADILQVQGKWEEAITIRREKELPVYRSLNDRHAVAETMWQIANALQERGELDEALHIYHEDLLPAFEHLGDDGRQAAILGEIAGIHALRGRSEEALMVHKHKELPIYLRTGDIGGQARAFVKIASIYVTQGKIDEALAIYEGEVLPREVRIGDMRGQATTYGLIAEAKDLRGEPQEALRLLQDKVLPVFRRVSDVHGEATCLVRIAQILFRLEQTDEVLRILKDEVLPVWRAQKNQREEAVALSLMADALDSRGDTGEAFSIRQEKVLPIVKQLRDVRGIAVTLSMMARELVRRGKRDEALRIRREQVLPILISMAAELDIAKERLSIAILVFEGGDTTEALRLMNEDVLPVFRRTGNSDGLASALSLVAGILQERGEFRRALDIYQEEIRPIYVRTGEAHKLANCLTAIANILSELGRHGESMLVLRHEVLPIYERTNARREKANVLDKIAQCLQQERQFRKVEAVLENELIPLLTQLDDRRGLVVCQAALGNMIMLRGDPASFDRGFNMIVEASKSARRQGFEEAKEIGDLMMQVFNNPNIQRALNSVGVKAGR